MQTRTVSRRSFLRTTLACAAVAGGGPLAGADKKFRAAIIGHTRQGDYGHGLDVIFNERDNVEVVAVADPDNEGRAKGKERSRARNDYADYREMLAREKPQLVSVAMRWTEQHYAICKAALDAGAHLFVEKPFTTTLAEADDLLRIARAKSLKIAVAHQMRLAPPILSLKAKIGDGLLGDMLQIRAHGKQDARAGGEDMLVLGTHLFDLMRMMAGDPMWCTASIFHKGREATVVDARDATEKIGRVLGDEIEAQFGFENGVHGTFTSRGRHRESAGHWGIELVGSKAVARILADISPRVFVRQSPAWSDAGAKIEWQPIEPGVAREPSSRGNVRLVDDWLAAIQSNREPASSGVTGRDAIEMVMAVYQAGLSRGRISFPLSQREHPLGKA